MSGEERGFTVGWRSLSRGRGRRSWWSCRAVAVAVAVAILSLGLVVGAAEVSAAPSAPSTGSISWTGGSGTTVPFDLNLNFEVTGPRAR